MATTTYGTPYVQSSDLVSAYPGTSSTLATRVDDVSLKGNGLNDQTGTAYTLVLTDAGKTVTLSNASAVTVTIPTNASVAFPIGTIARFVNKGAGTVTIQPTGGVTLNGGNLTLPQFAAVQVVKLATDTWGQLDSIGIAPGLALMSPSSIANTGGTASASGGTVTFNAVTVLSLNGVFTSAFQNYRIVMEYSASAGNTLNARLRQAGTDNSGAGNYVNQQFFASGTGSGAARSSGATNFWLGEYSSTQRCALSADIYSPQLATPTNLFSLVQYSGNSAAIEIFAGTHNQSTSYDGLTLLPVSGTIEGTVRIYGYRN